MNKTYNAKEYWEERLKNRFTLRGVGHIGFTERYNAWLYRRKRRCIENCFRATPLKEKKILDVGCGTGFFVDWYRKAGANVTGIDITNTSIERLKGKYDCQFYVQDITAENYQPLGSFDIVNMWDVIYHVVSPEKFAQAFYNIGRSIKSGGLLLFTDWFGLDVDSRIADHVQARCLKTYEQALPKNGFEFTRIL